MFVRQLFSHSVTSQGAGSIRRGVEVYGDAHFSGLTVGFLKRYYFQTGESRLAIVRREYSRKLFWAEKGCDWTLDLTQFQELCVG